MRWKYTDVETTLQHSNYGISRHRRGFVHQHAAVPFVKMVPSTLRYKKWYERTFHKSALMSVVFNSCGSLLAAGGLDGLVSVGDVHTGSILHCINARTPVHSLVWSSGPEGFIFGCENGILVSVFLEQVRFFLCHKSRFLLSMTLPRHRSGAHTFTHTPDLFTVYPLN